MGQSTPEDGRDKSLLAVVGSFGTIILGVCRKDFAVIAADRVRIKNTDSGRQYGHIRKTARLATGSLTFATAGQTILLPDKRPTIDILEDIGRTITDPKDLDFSVILPKLEKELLWRVRETAKLARSEDHLYQQVGVVVAFWKEGGPRMASLSVGKTIERDFDPPFCLAPDFMLSHYKSRYKNAGDLYGDGCKDEGGLSCHLQGVIADGMTHWATLAGWEDIHRLTTSMSNLWANPSVGTSRSRLPVPGDTTARPNLDGGVRPFDVDAEVAAFVLADMKCRPRHVVCDVGHLLPG
jgi:hypothetical protein